MSTSTQKLELPTESPSNMESDVPATATAKAKTSPENEPIETVQAGLARGGREGENALPDAVLAALSRPIKTVECNMMSYTDGEGVARQIYMPKGTIRLASALYTAKRFSDLARFPAWGECFHTSLSPLLSLGLSACFVLAYICIRLAISLPSSVAIRKTLLDCLRRLPS